LEGVKLRIRESRQEPKSTAPLLQKPQKRGTPPAGAVERHGHPPDVMAEIVAQIIAALGEYFVSRRLRKSTDRPERRTQLDQSFL
jgi:hypothetical protein